MMENLTSKVASISKDEFLFFPTKGFMGVVSMHRLLILFGE